MKASGLSMDISLKDLSVLVSSMSQVSQEDLLLIPGMEEKRVDIILSGAILLEELMGFLEAKKVIRTRFALREGVLQDQLRRLDWAVDFNHFEMAG
jgi:exopolyphosphatase/guanosine-5'-triphosphate,3'-diphosphate pyrophosphatase